MHDDIHAWLLENAGVPIRYQLTRDPHLADKLLENEEVTYWLDQLEEKAKTGALANIHGSHDYRLENILGKCWLLGLNRDVPRFHRHAQFYLRYLSEHIRRDDPPGLSFEKLYANHDYETVLACFLPLLGYQGDPDVRHIARKRIGILYPFTKQKRYDIYAKESRLPGVKKEWQPYLIDPALYADGNIALPSVHDVILLAGMYASLDGELQGKAETIIEWLLGEGYSGLKNRYGYFYAPGGAYAAKSILRSLPLPDPMAAPEDRAAAQSLLFKCFLLAHFKAGVHSAWLQTALLRLEQYGTAGGRYIFPPHMLTEKPDAYFTDGGHMNIGENKKSKHWREVISTWWMLQIKEAMGRFL